jgi:hypothetical protein
MKGLSSFADQMAGAGAGGTILVGQVECALGLASFALPGSS